MAQGKHTDCWAFAAAQAILGNCSAIWGRIISHFWSMTLKLLPNATQVQSMLSKLVKMPGDPVVETQDKYYSSI